MKVALKLCGPQKQIQIFVVQIMFAPRNLFFMKFAVTASYIPVTAIFKAQIQTWQLRKNRTFF